MAELTVAEFARLATKQSKKATRNILQSGKQGQIDILQAENKMLKFALDKYAYRDSFLGKGGFPLPQRGGNSERIQTPNGGPYTTRSDDSNLGHQIVIQGDNNTVIIQSPEKPEADKIKNEDKDKIELTDPVPDKKDEGLSRADKLALREDITESLESYMDLQKDIDKLKAKQNRNLMFGGLFGGFIGYGLAKLFGNSKLENKIEKLEAKQMDIIDKMNDNLAVARAELKDGGGKAAKQKVRILENGAKALLKLLKEDDSDLYNIAERMFDIDNKEGSRSIDRLIKKAELDHAWSK